MIRSGINGTDLKDELQQGVVTAFLNTAAAQGASAVGQNFDAGTVANYAAHAIVGCAVGAGRAAAGGANAGGGCGAGAAGAVVGEAAAIAYNSGRTPEDILFNGVLPDTNDVAALFAGIGVAIAGGDGSQVYIGASAGANAAQNNFGLSVMRDAAKACMALSACRNRVMGPVALAAIAARQAQVLTADGMTPRAAEAIAIAEWLTGTLPTPGVPLASLGSTTLPLLDPNGATSTVTTGVALPSLSAPGFKSSGPQGNDSSTVLPNNGPVGGSIVMSADPRLPIPTPTKGANGIRIESNGKHTPGLPGYNSAAGTEPRNSLDLFDKSVPSPRRPDDVRYAVDTEGAIHRFSNDGNGTFHWSGSTSDPKAPLDIRVIPNQIVKLK